MSKATIEEILHLESLVFKGGYSSASKQIEKLERHPRVSHEELLLIRYYKALILLEEGNINSALDIGRSNYSDVMQVEDVKLKVHYNYLLAHSLFQLGKLDDGRRYVEDLNVIMKNTTFPDQHLSNRLNIKLISLESSFLRFSGKYDEAIKYYIQIIDLCKKENDIIELYKTYNLIGSVYHEKGDYALGMANYELALDTARKDGHDKHIAYVLNDIGKLYIDRGEIDIAETYLQERIQMDEAKINDRIDSAYTLYSLGELEFLRGNYEKAFQFFIDGYTKIELVGTSRLESVGLSHLILTCVNLGLLYQADYYLNIEKELVERTNNINITGSYNYNCALVLRSKTRLTHVVQAQIILEEQLVDPKLSAEIQLKSMILLAEILLEELKITNNDTIFDMIKHMIDKLYRTGVSTEAYNVIINTLILQSKFALIDGDFAKAMENLDKATSYCEIKGLSSLAKKVNRDRKSLEENITKWRDIGKQSPELYDKIMLASIQEYLQDAQKIRSNLRK
ncbi:MAG: tetratricopeptide repeat protein [Candidatus Heimdallarchaeota archaeon]|nr:tetratricopeptide repeat protein [Candidatus Heimdallarchaeota archaeon]